MRMAVVGSPRYFEARSGAQVLQDLTAHRCINLRLPTHRDLYAWEFEKDGRELRVRVDGQLVFNSVAPLLKGARAGLGLCYVPEAEVQDHVKSGRLVRVLEDWCEPLSGYHLYYSSRRQPTLAFSLLVDALRYRDSRSLQRIGHKGGLGRSRPSQPVLPVGSLRFASENASWAGPATIGMPATAWRGQGALPWPLDYLASGARPFCV
jgi:hypothetical protein